ncbi:MAG TPA: protein kinase, partial [Streptosporangiaceae bacterium]
MIVGLRAGDPRRVGPYELLGRLGCGGMGSVFLGRPADGSLAAVKVIRADLAGDPGFRARFSQEVTAAGKVSGQFTAALADADTTGPVPWLATSYVPGPSLAELVRLHGALPLSSVLVLGAGLAAALGAIHEADLVHRDLKPSNVLVAADGPRVIDFGISRAAGAASLTLAGMVMGSPGFMSPEQAQGGPVGPASDVFSLGTLLAFAVTGQGPFGAGSMAALLYRVVYGQPSTEDLPRQLRPLVVRCLAKDPGDRPTAAELRAQLGAASPAVDWLPAPVARTLSRFAVPEDTLAEAARTEAAPMDAASQPGDAVDTPVWLPMTGSQLPVPADSGPASAAPGSAVPASAGLAGQLAAVGSSPAAAGLLRPLAAMRLAGMGGADPETGMELPVAGGQLPGPGHQFPAPGHQFPGPVHQFPGLGDQAVGTDEDPTVTAARPRPLRNVPGPPAAAVAPPRHPGRRRRSRRWAAAGAVTGAAGVLLGVMLSGVLQPAARPAAHPDKAAAKLPGP